MCRWYLRWDRDGTLAPFAASKILQRYARTYLAHQKYVEMKEDTTMTPEKKRETLQKILYPHRYGKAKLGLKGLQA